MCLVPSLPFRNLAKAPENWNFIEVKTLPTKKSPNVNITVWGLRGKVSYLRKVVKNRKLKKKKNQVYQLHQNRLISLSDGILSHQRKTHEQKGQLRELYLCLVKH